MQPRPTCSPVAVSRAEMLRKQQTQALFKDPTQEVCILSLLAIFMTADTELWQSLFRQSFGLPDEEVPLSEVNAVLSLQDKEDIYVRASLHAVPWR